MDDIGLGIFDSDRLALAFSPVLFESKTEVLGGFFERLALDVELAALGADDELDPLLGKAKQCQCLEDGKPCAIMVTHLRRVLLCHGNVEILV